MGLLQFLKSLFFGKPKTGTPARRRRSPRKPVTMRPLRYQPERTPFRSKTCEQPPYRFAQFSQDLLNYLDLSQDGDPHLLDDWELPVFETPEQLANWLEMPLSQVAWLIHRFSLNKPESESAAHYHFCWKQKRLGGMRLIESPKPLLKQTQKRILVDILNPVPTHPAAHGFTIGRSAKTNAAPHCRQRVIVKMDLENFYASINFNRVAAIFRGLGYSREAALWLSRLTTSALPQNMPFPAGNPSAILPYLKRHLPQGAPTSPALANLSAFALDVRLFGLARSFHAQYTRYADDLTFSGPQQFLNGLHIFIPLAKKIIRDERFVVHVRKQKVIRNNQRQTVTGVVVNQHPNINRKEFDSLKAILHNCRRYGSASQNRSEHDNFSEHLRGRVAYIQHINPKKGAKLLQMYDQINWNA